MTVNQGRILEITQGCKLQQLETAELAKGMMDALTKASALRRRTLSLPKLRVHLRSGRVLKHRFGEMHPS